MPDKSRDEEREEKPVGNQREGEPEPQAEEDDPTGGVIKDGKKEG